LSLFAIAETESPLRMSDQMVFCFWLSGADKVQFGHITYQ
jgi:hypothetical protein